MLDAEKKYYLEDVIELTGISERNIKFWVAEYRLKVFKEGRKNLYPPITITLLNLIKELTESKLFTTKFIQIQVERCKNPSKTNIKGLQELNDITKKMLQYLFEMTEDSQIEMVAEEAAVAAEKKTSSPPLSVEENSEERVEEEEYEPSEFIDQPVSEDVIIDDLVDELDGQKFQPVDTSADESIRKVLKELKSPIIMLANEPRDKKISFWQQIKKILR